MESYMIYLPIILATIGLIYMTIKKSWVLKQDAGNGKMKEISDHIYEGALAFLKAEYRLLAIFVVVVSILLFIVSDGWDKLFEIRRHREKKVIFFKLIISSAYVSVFQLSEG